MDPVFGTIIILLLVAALAFSCIRYLIRERRKGGCAGCPSGSSAQSGCAGCPYSNQCAGQPKIASKE